MSTALLPADARTRLGERANLGLLLCISIAARAGYLLIKPASAVSLDVRYWQQVAAAMRGGTNPYQTGLVPYLPVWPSILASLNWTSKWSHLPFISLLWIFLIAVEMALLAVTYRVLRRSVSEWTARNILLLAIALNPAAIVQVTQHGNFDVLMMLFVMLSIDALIRYHERGTRSDWLAGCGWLGVGILTKTVPLALTPLLMSGARRMPMRAIGQGALRVAGPVAIGLALVACLSGSAGLRDVLMYRSVHGYFGISAVLATLDGVEYPALGPWLRSYAAGFTIAVPLALVAIAFVLWNAPWKRAEQIALAAGLILVSIIVLGTGFGAQYVYWIIPPLAVSYGQIDDPRWRRLLMITWGIIAITYSFDYLFNPGYGAALHERFPMSQTVYIIQQHWHRPAEQAILRLPMFSALVAVLIEGVRQIRRLGQNVPASLAAAV